MKSGSCIAHPKRRSGSRKERTQRAGNVASSFYPKGISPHDGSSALAQPDSISPNFQGHSLNRIPVFPTGPRRPPVQAKLQVHSPGDRFEKEADRIAEQVVRSEKTDKPSVSRKGVQRACKACSESGTPCPSCRKEEEERPAVIQRKARYGEAGLGVSPVLEEKIQDRMGKGQAMSIPERAMMESRFGQDFSQVRIHTDTAAARLNQALQARAFTVGNEIFFQKGEFRPGTREGRKLLAHELAHTLQQSQSSFHSIQRSPGSPAGGCGICFGSPANAGTAVHSIVELEFETLYGPDIVQTEFPLLPSTGDDNGRLDLSVFTGNRVGIGEIKPANPRGLLQGDLDLMWYEDQLEALGFDVGRLNLPPPLLPIPFRDPLALNCPAQELFVNPPVHGIYTYYCEPDFSVLRSRCRCGQPGGRRVRQEQEQEQEQRERSRRRTRGREYEYRPIRIPDWVIALILIVLAIIIVILAIISSPVWITALAAILLILIITGSEGGDENVVAGSDIRNIPEVAAYIRTNQASLTSLRAASTSPPSASQIGSLIASGAVLHTRLRARSRTDARAAMALRHIRQLESEIRRRT